MESEPYGTCPFSQGGPIAPTKGAMWAVYCRRPDGVVRIPSREDYLRFCASGRYRECPGYGGMAGDPAFLGSAAR